MFDLPVYDFLFKVGIILVIISFVVGFYGNSYNGIAFSLHYYQYLYILVICFAGIRYGLAGGFLCSTALSILHIIALNFNENYYKYQNLNVHYNFQIILFVLVGIVTGYGYELMASKVSSMEKGYKAYLRNRNNLPSDNKKEEEKNNLLSSIKSDVNIKNVNVLFKFTKNLFNNEEMDGVFEGLTSILALDYNAKEIVVFRKNDQRMVEAISGKNYSGEIPLNNLKYNVGEFLPGKCIASGQFINLESPPPDSNWVMAIPIIVGKNCTHCVAVAKWKSIKKLDPEEIQNIMRMSTILGNYIKLIQKKSK